MKRDSFSAPAPGYEGVFGGAFVGRRVLVTGHTGFKGSWLVLWLRMLGAQVFGLGLPMPGQHSHAELLGLPIAHTLTDLRDAGATRRAVMGFEPEIVFHLAAQPLVRRSYREPVATWSSNVMGLLHLFEAVRATPAVRVLVNVTSDKCYQQGDRAHAFQEGDALGGYDPYSASKACAEIASDCWRKSFFAHDDGRGHSVALITARAGNVIGGGDWAEDRLLPDLVRNAIAGVATPLRHPHSTRPWQHVLEPLAGYLTLAAHALHTPGDAGEAWNFGPDAAGHISVGELATRLSRHWPAMRWQRADDTQALHEAPTLSLDTRKAQRELGWRPVWDIDTTLRRTARHYRLWHERAQLVSFEDLDQYLHDARALCLPWAGAVPAQQAA